MKHIGTEASTDFSHALNGVNALPLSTEPSVPEIMVYSDTGASFRYVEKFLQERFPETAIVRVKGSDLRDSEWMTQQHGIIVLPGITSENCPYYDQIGSEGRDNIRDFLERDKNTLLTFCAGTYVLHEEIRYNLFAGGQKRRQSPLALMAGKAEGPPEGLSIAPEEDFTLTPITYQNAEGEQVTTLLAHGNGPALDEAAILSQGGQLLGRYAEVEGNPAAGCSLSIGQGQIIALGTIPYFEPSNPTSFAGSGQSDKMRLMQEYEPGRRAYCNFVLGLIAEHNPQLKPVYFTDINAIQPDIAESVR